MKKLTILPVILFSIVALAHAEQKPTDPQIAAIVVAANQVDIDAGKFAESRSTDTKVKDFAHMMVVDHASVNKKAVDLVTKLKVTPEENATSKSLEEGGLKNIEHLKTLKGKEFDKAYIDHEVAYHEQVLAAVDSLLIPNAKNEELKALLVKVRPAFVTHLNHAKDIQASIQ